MNLGAMIDLGVDFDILKRELSKLNLEKAFDITLKKADKHGIFGSKVDVIDLENHHHHHHHSHSRNYRDIKTIIEKSTLSARVKRDSIGIFEIIASAEAKIHNKSIDEIHFHEVGAIDSIVDVVGASICMEQLAVTQVYSSTIEVGSGFVNCAHGKMPVPAPATAEILIGLTSQSKVKGYEMTTPTGAAILKYYVKDHIAPATYQTAKIGYGLGSRDLEIPNLLRVSIIEDVEKAKQNQQYLIETNIDDCSAEDIAYAKSLLLEAGARDVYQTPIVMKKGRSAIKLSVLTTIEDKEKILHIIYKHTTAIGARGYSIDKYALDREIVTVESDYGKVRVKVSYYNDAIINIKPEYDDCIAISKAKKLPLNIVRDNIIKCYKDTKNWC